MNHPGLWFQSQHWPVPRHVTLWQKMLVTLPVTFPLAVLTTSAVYSGFLEADMSENYPAYSSVKWDVLHFFCLRVSWMQSAGHSQVQVASVYGKCLFDSRSQAAPLQASTGWNIHESPWLMIPIPAALVCPKTCDTVAEDACNIASHLLIDLTHDKWGIFTQSWSRHSRESLPSPDETDLSRHSHSSLEEEHILQHWLPWTMYVEGRPSVGQIVVFPCMPSCRAVWWAIQLWWLSLHGFEDSCAEIGETNPKLWLEQWHIRRSFAVLLKALSLKPTFQPTSSPEQASRLLVTMQQRRFFNECPMVRIRSAMLNAQSPAELFNWCQAFVICKMTRIR